jgi:DnaJ-domain-containing protein 1
VSIGKRLFNLARAELRGAVGAMRTRRDEWPEPEPRLERDAEPDPGGRPGADTSAGADARQAPPRRRRRGEVVLPDDAEIRRYYANLELPLGASADEVKAAYRRLMRRYHPDHHQGSPEQAQLATQLARELRIAYDGLLAHLERTPRT